MNNHIVCDINKVQWASLVYKNQFGDCRQKKPKTVTVHNTPVTEAEIEFSTGRNLIEVAKEKGIIDVWTPVLRLQFSANHSLVYLGEKALSLWKAWQSKIFGKN
jgi:hypothetical protein